MALTPPSLPPAVVTVAPGDTLWRIAATTLGDPGRWRILYDANQTLIGADPDLIQVGQRLTVPHAAPGIHPAAGLLPHPDPAAHDHPDPVRPAGGDPRALALVATARTWLGVPYLFGGDTRAGIDCSALVQAIYRSQGIRLQRTTFDQIGAGRAVSPSALQPGDILFYGPDHEALYIGGGQVIEAPHTGTVVRQVSTSWGGRITAARRILPDTPPAPTPTPTSATASSATSVSTTSGGTTVADAKAYASAHLGADQAQCLFNIIEHESGFDPNAVNASSGAGGLMQALPPSKQASAGPDWKTNPVTQVKWGISYVDERYGSACAAWAFWQGHSFY